MLGRMTLRVWLFMDSDQKSWSLEVEYERSATPNVIDSGTRD
jgi:hypothetical protein